MEQTTNIFAKLPEVLLPWYADNKRDLPWREDTDPYHVWLSEIMLQQTRVETVKGYYTRFLQTFPTVQSLANADDELLHKHWEGLGYYTRVRNLKKAAQVITNTYGGIMPRSFEQILSLPGIGSYTAGAICSIAFDMPKAAVDGNVLRVAARLTNDSTPVNKPAYAVSVRLALEQIYPVQAGHFTQALMELGATVCGPNREPDCENCPCQAFCLGYKEGTARQLPVKERKPARRVEERTVFILHHEKGYALCKRPKGGLLAGLWQFPNVEGKLEIQQAIFEVEKIGLKPTEIIKTVERKHIFTHIEWYMRGIYMEVTGAANDLQWFTEQQLQTSTALPTAFRLFLQEERKAEKANILQNNI